MVIEYNTPYELWKKASDGTLNIGWQLVGYIKYFGNNIVHSSLGPSVPVWDESAPMVIVDVMFIINEQEVTNPTMSYDTLMDGYYMSVTAGSFFSYIKQVRNIPESNSFNTGSIYCVSASNMYDATAGFWEIYANGELYFQKPGDSFKKITKDDTSAVTIQIANPYIQDPYNYKNINDYGNCPMYEQPLYTVSSSVGSASIVVNNVQENGIVRGNWGWARGWANEANRDAVYQSLVTASQDMIDGGTLRLTMHPRVSCWFDFGGYGATGGDVYVFPDKNFDVAITPTKYSGSLQLTLPVLGEDYTNIFQIWLCSGSNREEAVRAVDASNFSVGESYIVDISDVLRRSNLPAGLSDPVTLAITARTHFVPETGSLEVAFDVTAAAEAGDYSLSTITNVFRSSVSDGWEQGWSEESGHMQVITFDKFSEFSGMLMITRTTP